MNMLKNIQLNSVNIILGVILLSSIRCASFEKMKGTNTELPYSKIEVYKKELSKKYIMKTYYFIGDTLVQYDYEVYKSVSGFASNEIYSSSVVFNINRKKAILKKSILKRNGTYIIKEYNEEGKLVELRKSKKVKTGRKF